MERDYPKEIAEARKTLYQSQQAVMARRRRQKVQILYPAKLCIDGSIVRNMFPDWSACMKQNRITWTASSTNMNEGLDGEGGGGWGRGAGRFWNSLISKNLAHYSLSLKFVLNL